MNSDPSVLEEPVGLHNTLELLAEVHTEVGISYTHPSTTFVMYWVVIVIEMHKACEFDNSAVA